MARKGKIKLFVRVLLFAFILLTILGLASIAFADTLYWETKEPAPRARGASASAVVGGKMYIIGGLLEYTVGQDPTKPSRVVRVYDPNADPETYKWQLAPSLSEPRWASCAVSKGNTIYVIGGGGGPGYADTVLAYDTSNNIEPCSTIGHIITPRWGAGAAIVENNDNMIYIVGGNSGGSNIVDTIEAYNLSDNTSNVVAHLPDQRDGAGVVSIGNKIYIIGGVDGSHNITNICWEYDPSNNNFATIAPMPIATGGAGMTVVVNKKIYVIGGAITDSNHYPHPTTCIANVQEYNPETNTWAIKASMPTARFAASAGVIDGRIYVVGGHNLQNMVATNECATIETGTDDSSAIVPGPGDVECGVINITFPSGTSSGTLAVSTSQNGPTERPTGVNFHGSYYDIATSAQYTGTLRVTIPYDAGLTPEQEANLRLYHWNGSEWDNVTVLPVDTENNRITGEATSLSPFVVGYSSGGGSSAVPTTSTWSLVLMGLLAVGILRLRLLRRPKGLLAITK